MVKSEILDNIVDELVGKHKCHTVILYGSHARGYATPKSDYDVYGVRKSGRKFRIAEKRNGIYVDLFVVPEKELAKIDDSKLFLAGAKVIYQKGSFGARFLKKLKAAESTPYKPLPPDELNAHRMWAFKMLERIEIGDTEALFRRAWLQMQLLEDYFAFRKKRYWGSKASFEWLKKNDLATYKLFGKTLKNPDYKTLKKLVQRVTQIKQPK